ncbi:MAG: endonuclease, partial [Clostridia bacterium]|nr:endonuclease [Clostridia bacterium]
MRLTKRFLSFVLVLALSLSLLPAAEAKTGTLVSNTGTRHEVCTALSSQAQAYYTGNYTYDAVSGLAASSSAPMSSAMFSRLSTLMRTTMTKTVSYSSLTSYWPKTDANNGSGNPVLFYSDEISGNFNREHVWPKSRGSFKETNAGSDLHHLRPTNADINSTRGNMTMGNVKGVFTTYKTKALNGGTVLWYNTDADIVEVRDNIKGDVARILLYVWCRWQEPNLYENDPNPTIGSGDDANNGLKVIESLDTLLEWMELDPVDTWEMSRNDQCENVQGNRNVFIDYPEYAWLLFGLTPPSDYQTPSGEAMNTTSFTITAVANNSAWGSVSLSGRTVTATPNTGYYAESATVSPAGAATLTQSGNTFTVSNLTADCTVTVNFAAKTACTVSFDANGGTGTMASQQVYAGEDFTLPACGFTAPGGQRFAGWKRSLDNTVYQPNATVTVNGDCAFIAQWQALSSDAEYVLVETASSDWSGDYLIVYNAGPYAMNGSLTSLDATSNYKTVTLSEKTITVAADENDFYFTVEPNGSGYAIKAASGKYIGRSSNANGLESSNTALPVTLSLSGTDANIVSGGAYLRFNEQSGQTRFRFYKSGSYTGQKAISLYKRVEVAPLEPAVPSF